MVITFSFHLINAILVFLSVCLGSVVIFRNFVEHFGDIESSALSRSSISVVLWALFACFMLILSSVWLIFNIFLSIS
jgi:hypothetical protein